MKEGDTERRIDSKMKRVKNLIKDVWMNGTYIKGMGRDRIVEVVTWRG